MTALIEHDLNDRDLIDRGISDGVGFGRRYSVVRPLADSQHTRVQLCLDTLTNAQVTLKVRVYVCVPVFVCIVGLSASSC